MSTHRERQRRYLQNLRERAYALFGRACQECGLPDLTGAELEFAHDTPTTVFGMGRGMAIRYRDVLKNCHCYVLLCSKCHKQKDRGWK